MKDQCYSDPDTDWDWNLFIRWTEYEGWCFCNKCRNYHWIDTLDKAKRAAMRRIA